MVDELKLGKLPAKEDPKGRTVRLRSILVKKYLPALPEAYDIDAALGGIDDSRMFANNEYGNCVIAARAHQTLRFEKGEQGRQIDIADQEVIDQYLIETGGGDWGLILLESLKSWRKNGWPVGDQNYTIYAFASVDWKSHTEVKHCIHLLHGINFGMRVYQKDMDQFNAGEPWHLTGDNGQFRGGHGVYACQYNTYIGRRIAPTIKVLGYNQFGIWCMTWGKKQFMTYDFWDARVDEAYGIVDNRNEWMAEDSPVDVEKLDGYLKEITGDGEEPLGCPFWPVALIKKMVKPVIKGVKHG